MAAARRVESLGEEQDLKVIIQVLSSNERLQTIVGNKRLTPSLVDESKNKRLNKRQNLKIILI